MTRSIQIHLGEEEYDERRAALEAIAAQVGAIGQRGASISRLNQMIADGELEVRMNEEQMALMIYREVFGHVDNKYFKSEKVGEIRDWLLEGDLDDDSTIAELSDEWREYDADEVARRA